MPVLLTLDLLGTEQKLQLGGPGAAAALYDDFADLVLDTAASVDAAPQLRGDIEGPWAALVCPTVESALALARRIFRRAWLDPRSSDDIRLWLRGAVVPTDDEAVRHTAPDEDLAGIQRTTATPGMMRGLGGLRGGFAGMRILVDEALLNDQLRGMFRVPLGRLGFIPFRRMNFTPYPPNLRKTLQDFLWMAENLTEWANYQLRAKQRMLWSAGDPAEFEHAAATQVVFHEVDAIVQSVVRKNQTRRDDGRGRRQEPAAEHGGED